jgi:alpha-tubulin suppressor-like RCC1 family protein
MRLSGTCGLLVVACCSTLGCADAAPERSDSESCPGTDGAVEGDGTALTSVAAGLAGTCATVNDGTLLCWGDSVRSGTPTPVPEMGSVTAVAVGISQTCVIRTNGGVLCESSFDSEPTFVPGLCDATALMVGRDSKCAVASDGGVRCWGGLNETVFGKRSSTRAVAVPDVADAVALAAGAFGYTCALIADGSVTCWGGGPRGADRPGILPAPVPEISGAVALAGSDGVGNEMCAVLEDGSVTCWTHALAGEPVAGLEDAVSVAVAMSHGCAVLADGSVRCWGNNMSGQLGDGTNDDSETPVVVEGLSDVSQIVVQSLDSTMGRSCALLADGTARCWGSNQDGALGDGGYLDSNTPVEVSFP